MIGKSAHTIKQTGPTVRKQVITMPEPNYNVCLCNDSFPPVIDGVANAVQNYARVITDLGAKAVVATPQYPDVIDDYPYRVIRYQSYDTTSAFGYRTGNPFDTNAITELAALDYQVIHSHCPMSSTLLARTLREAKNVPVVFTYHTKFDIDIKNAVRSNLMQEVAVRAIVENISACDEVWTVSRGAGENLRSLGYEGDFRVMQNGVDFAPGRVPAEMTAALDRQYDLPEGLPVFLFTGRMMWYKGIRLILDGLAGAKAAGCDFRMVFVGGGGDCDEITAYAKEQKLEDRCIFVGRVQDRDLLRAWCCRADLFLFPSTFDTNGLVVREAAACSLASMLIRGSCAAEGVTDGVNGILIDERAEAIAALVARFCENGCAGLRDLGERACRDLYLSWDSAVRTAYSAYGEVIERYAARQEEKPRWRGGSIADAPFKAIAQAAENLDRLREARRTLRMGGRG